MNKYLIKFYNIYFLDTSEKTTTNGTHFSVLKNYTYTWRYDVATNWTSNWTSTQIINE